MLARVIVAIIVLGLSFYLPVLQVSAQDVPRTQTQIRLSFAPVVKRTAPAVVNVFSRRIVRQKQFSPLFDDPFFRRFFDRGPRRRQQNSLGSGVIVSSDGFIVTNHHVVKQADQIRVVMSDGQVFQAKIVLKDDKTDLAILKVKSDKPLPFLKFHDSDNLEVGDLVLAIGNPFGVGQTVTSGIVSALARSNVGISDFQFFIQTDAAINPGNSGGALINIDGELIGINTAIFSRSGGSNGIGFAIPANMVRFVVASARSGNKGVRRPWFGAQLQKITPEISESLGLKRPRGALVKAVHPKGPAAQAGLKRGDVVTDVDGKQIAHPQELHYRLATKPIGRLVELKVISGGRDRQVKLKMQLPPEDPPRNTRLLRSRHPFQGAEVANLSPAVADELKLGFSHKGVVILSARSGISRKLRLQRGDIIVSIEGEKIVRVKQLVAILRDGPRREWYFTFRRGTRLVRMRVAG